MDLSSKENTSVAKLTERTKPALVQVGEHQIILHGRWNHELIADHVAENGRDRWIGIGELAKIGCGANTIPNKKRARGKLSELFKMLRSRGLFLAVEYSGDHGSATAVKIADLNSEQDRQNVQDRLERMKRRKELSQDEYFKAMQLLGVMQTEQTGVSENAG